MGRHYRRKAGPVDKSCSTLLTVGQSKACPESGQELVEYALVFPLLFLLLFGLLEVGLIAFSYNTITNGAREGARYGIFHLDDEGRIDEDGIKAAVCSEFYTRMISETATITSSREGDWIRVEVTYPVTLITIAFARALPRTWDVTRPIVENMNVGPTLQLKAVSMMPIE